MTRTKPVQAKGKNENANGCGDVGFVEGKLARTDARSRAPGVSVLLHASATWPSFHPSNDTQPRIHYCPTR
jgi:hypothetical protein